MSKLLVAAIDFGTTYSGFAFSFAYDYKHDPLQIYLNRWTAGSGFLQSEKTPTCVLFSPDRKFDSFGYEAENKYSELALENKHRPWYYFRRFKMDLYNKEGISRSHKIKEDGGEKSMDALIIFSASIKYLKEKMVDRCKQQVTGIEEDDIHWVLTVPAIWSDPAKQFMREAAVLAGIPSTRLKIALEPEAASLNCKYLPIEKNGNIFKPLSKYMVIDAGGGTIDITVHEVQENNSLKELYKANGGAWGGTKVDEALECLLADIVGEDVMKAFSKLHKMDYLDLFRDFEYKKRTIKPDLKKDNLITFKVPTSLTHILSDHKGKRISSTIQSKPKYKEKITWVGDKLRMEANLTKALFDESCDHIVRHIQSLFRIRQIRDVKTILLVGGYADSPMLQEAIKANFSHVKLIIPPEPALTVLKGAVIFGHEPDAISSRVCKYTYGVRTYCDFIANKHPFEKKILVNGIEKCKDVFSIHVRVGETLRVGEPTASQRYHPLLPDQTKVRFVIYTSPSSNPEFTSDEGCRRLGSLSIDMPDILKGVDRAVNVQMIFSGTEIEVYATDKDTKKTVKTTVDFLE
ncbi:heat shock 70 kDa protein 12A-like [Saccostrea echinata]|uniref:heat shock 70 kDa protein 12A-like n=1 Tax=Saccostrea echinata TaxID=191078 RepID=UPI002A83FEAF|nr:heat shock 70 kDa protein 12A-like [Saccostrea echinata]